MGDLRISDVVETTRLSARYWQRRAAMGEIPGVSYVQHGQRKTYLFDADTFLCWWQEQKKAANVVFSHGHSILTFQAMHWPLRLGQI